VSAPIRWQFWRRAVTTFSTPLAGVALFAIRLGARSRPDGHLGPTDIAVSVVT
jgi:hypothetical protein